MRRRSPLRSVWSGRRRCSDERRSKRHAIVAKDGPVHMICRKTRKQEKQQKAAANSCLQRRWKASVDEKPILKLRSPHLSTSALARHTRVTSTRATEQWTQCATRTTSEKQRNHSLTRFALTMENARPPVGLLPTSFSIVPAPNGRPIRERAASCSSPPTQPPWCCAVARGEKINLQVRKVLLGNEAPLYHL